MSRVVIDLLEIPAANEPLDRKERDYLWELWKEVSNTEWRIIQTPSDTKAGKITIFDGDTKIVATFGSHCTTGLQNINNATLTVMMMEALPRLLTQVAALEKEVAKAEKQAKLANERAYSLEEQIIYLKQQ